MWEKEEELILQPNVITEGIPLTGRQLGWNVLGIPQEEAFFFFLDVGGESIQWSVSFVVFLFQKCYSTCQAVEAFILFFILKELYIKSSYFVHLDAQKLSSIKV